ncbi:PilZ domain-containing protein [bacterium D16-51]|nr:PilZ domain-containing protein [bacterium D16-59]RKI59961.1 PilZ domain-containing protein [bacterium D16-51]
MEEQRRAKRTPIQMSLEVSSVFKQDNVRVRHMHAPIEIRNISRNGIGFVTESILPIGYYFDAKLNFMKTGESLKCVVRILRQSKEEDGKNFYGCEFVGLSSVFDYIFDEIEGLEEE